MPTIELKDVRPPVDLPANYFFLFVILGLVLLGGIFFFLRWLLPKLKSKKETRMIRKTAWEIATQELLTLEKENLPSRGEIKEYFIRLSSIVRHYLEDRFLVKAPEMTTDEFLMHVKTLAVLNEAQKEFLKEFLTASDMVKFARYGSTASEMTDAFNAAKRLVQETMPKEAIK